MPGALPGVTGPAVLLLVELELLTEQEHVMQVIHYNLGILDDFLEF